MNVAIDIYATAVRDKGIIYARGNNLW